MGREPWRTPQLRLGQANAKRRNFFRYCRTHREKLAKEPTVRLEKLEQDIAKSAIDSIPKTFAKTSASTIGPINLQAVDDGFDDPGCFTTAAISITDDRTEHALTVPNLTSIAESSTDFECPYCLTISNFNGQRGFRKHVFDDLQPYVCLAKSCGMLMFPDSRSWMEHEMQEHHRVWQCQICSDKFKSADHLKSHAKRKHGDSIQQSRLDTFVKTCSRPLDSFSATECDFCDWATKLRALEEDVPYVATTEPVVPASRFLKHLARHLEQAALFSLPRITFSEVDSAVAGMGEECSYAPSQALSQSHSSESRSSVSEELEVEATSRVDLSAAELSKLPGAGSKGDVLVQGREADWLTEQRQLQRETRPRTTSETLSQSQQVDMLIAQHPLHSPPREKRLTMEQESERIQEGIQESQRRLLKERALDLMIFPTAVLHSLALAVPGTINTWGKLKQHIRGNQAVLPADFSQRLQTIQQQYYEQRPDEVQQAMRNFAEQMKEMRATQPQSLPDQRQPKQFGTGENEPVEGSVHVLLEDMLNDTSNRWTERARTYQEAALGRQGVLDEGHGQKQDLRQDGLDDQPNVPDPFQHDSARPLPPVLSAANEPFRSVIQAYMHRLPRGARLLTPCDRCRRSRTDCVKHNTSCVGCKNIYARCHWRDVSRDEVRAVDHGMYLPDPLTEATEPEVLYAAEQPIDRDRSRSRSVSQSDVSRNASPDPSEMTTWGFRNNNGTWSCAYPGCTSRSRFNRGCDLRKHYKRHTKSLFCRHDGCPQATEGGFSSKKDRARHEAKHNANIQCEWEGCNRVFSRVDNMKDHMRRVHKWKPVATTILMPDPAPNTELNFDEVNRMSERASKQSMRSRLLTALSPTHAPSQYHDEISPSLLPSRFMSDNELPNPSTFYPDWGFGRSIVSEIPEGDFGAPLDGSVGLNKEILPPPLTLGPSSLEEFDTHSLPQADQQSRQEPSSFQRSDGIPFSPDAYGRYGNFRHRPAFAQQAQQAQIPTFGQRRRTQTYARPLAPPKRH